MTSNHPDPSSSSSSNPIQSTSKISNSIEVLKPTTTPQDRRRKPSRTSTSIDPIVISRNKRSRRNKANGSSKPSTHKSSKQSIPSQPITPNPIRNPLRNYLSTLSLTESKSEKNSLDKTSIRTEAPRKSPKILPENRIFGLEHCPIFFPTNEEFKDPMKYFDLISNKLKEFGIGKIVPPEGWRAPCVLDTDSFKFKTRLQKLNSMEATSRATSNFLEQLFLFHRQQGTTQSFLSSTKIQVPNINHRPVDLWRVRKGVRSMGGYETVTAQRKWSFLAKSLGYDVVRSPAIAFQLKSTYLKILVPFDDYMNRVMSTNQVDTIKKTLVKSDSLSPLTSPVDENRVGNADDNGGVNDHEEGVSANTNHNTPGLKDSVSRETSTWDDTIDRGGEICEICGSDEDDPNILLCDCCDKGFHLQCLRPALSKVPEGNWFCDKCIISTGNEFGFEEGEEYKLNEFQIKADRFKKKWIESHPITEKSFKLRSPLKQQIQIENQEIKLENDLDEDLGEWGLKEFQDELALEDHIEREFWRLVETQNEPVEVEYGADIHSSTYGSAFPHVEKHPLEPYAKDGWNLNNLPIAPGSLLRYIKSDIAGMTQPWIYVGMVFSTFAWHKEDHYTYSVNYHHWGDTKTWYGVPGEDDEKLENAMKEAAPELFEQQPDIMYQLVTLMSPGRLKKSGVRTYVCDQRPNEFVITCPRSYHSGFNHGFNLNEAVNFCLPDWLKDGELCVKHYKILHKLPVFSHDELLMTIFTYEKSPRVSRWLLPHFRGMVTRELNERENARKSITNLSTEEMMILEDLPEDQIQCNYCKSLGFLSHLICTTSTNSFKVSCLDHSDTLGDGIKVLRLKYSDTDLEAMLARVSNRSTKAGRVVDLTGVEQRTSSRKRKPSAALLEAARAALPLAQKMKLGHSTEVDGNNAHMHDSSLDYDADERMEEMSMDSEMHHHMMLGHEAKEAKVEKVEEEVGTWLSSIKKGTSTPTSLPNQTFGTPNSQTRSKGKAQTVKLTSNALPLEFPSPLDPGGEPNTPIKDSTNLELNHQVGIATPGSMNKTRRPSTHARHAIPGKKRGRPPKSAELRATEAAAKLETKRLLDLKKQESLSLSQVTTPISQSSSSSQRISVVAQIDVAGSASIVTLENSLDSHSPIPTRLIEPVPNSRKRRRIIGGTDDEPNQEEINMRLNSNPPQHTQMKSSNNVIKIKPISRSVSQPLKVSNILGNQPNHSELLEKFKQEANNSSSGNQVRSQEYNYKVKMSDSNSKTSNMMNEQQINSNNNNSALGSSSKQPSELGNHRSSTPSSLSNILNPVNSQSQEPMIQRSSTSTSTLSRPLQHYPSSHQAQASTSYYSNSNPPISPTSRPRSSQQASNPSAPLTHTLNRSPNLNLMTPHHHHQHHQHHHHHSTHHHPHHHHHHHHVHHFEKGGSSNGNLPTRSTTPCETPPPLMTPSNRYFNSSSQQQQQQQQQQQKGIHVTGERSTTPSGTPPPLVTSYNRALPSSQQQQQQQQAKEPKEKEKEKEKEQAKQVTTITG